MLTNKFISYFIAAVLVTQIQYSVAADSATHGPIVSNASKSGTTYYHMTYTLSPEALFSLEQLSKDEFIAGGGQFEALLRKSHFPIPAPNCKRNIVLRMPWTEETSHLEEKYELYTRMRNVLEQNKGSVAVVIELNPYVKYNGSTLELTYCNVFFRHAKGAYISHTNAIH